MLSAWGITGGAVYDAMVGLAAGVEHGSRLATRDQRARATHDAVGVDTIVVG